MYFAGLASRRWRVAARGCRSKQTASLKHCAFAEDLVVFEVSSIERKGGCGGNRVYVARVRIGRAVRKGETSYRSVKPLS